MKIPFFKKKVSSRRFHFYIVFDSVVVVVVVIFCWTPRQQLWSAVSAVFLRVLWLTKKNKKLNTRYLMCRTRIYLWFKIFTSVFQNYVRHDVIQNFKIISSFISTFQDSNNFIKMSRARKGFKFIDKVSFCCLYVKHVSCNYHIFLSIDLPDITITICYHKQFSNVQTYLNSIVKICFHARRQKINHQF